MAHYTLYPCANCMILIDNAEHKSAVVFPTNEARFKNRAWDLYLMTHNFLDHDWELNYNLVDKEFSPEDVGYIPTDVFDFIRKNIDDHIAHDSYVRYLERYQNTNI